MRYPQVTFNVHPGDFLTVHPVGYAPVDEEFISMIHTKAPNWSVLTNIHGRGRSAVEEVADAIGELFFDVGLEQEVGFAVFQLVDAERIVGEA